MVDTNISSKIELFLSCRRLVNKDVFSKSDPMAVLSMKDGINYRSMSKIDRTEVIDNNLNPDFKKRFVLDYHFERRQELLIQVFDVDSSRVDRTSDHDFLGMARTTLADLVSRGKAALPLCDKAGRTMKQRSMVIVRCRELGDTSLICNLTMQGNSLPKMDLFGKADPYLEIYKKSAVDNSWLPVTKTEVQKYTYKPRWKPLELSAAALCNNDRKLPLLFKCFDWDRNSTPDRIGQFETTLEELEAKQPLAEFLLRKPKDAGKKRPKKRGSIGIALKLRKEHTFLEYIRGGCQINLTVAVDFTASNGDPREARSLHFIGHGFENAYQKAMVTIGNILTPYDSDNKYPLFGFGARIKRTNRVEHCFPLTMNEADPEVKGVQGILEAYRGAFNHVLLSGPTYFSEVLAMAAANASAARFNNDSQEYHILLILTDGRYDDERQSIDQIVAASTLPLSIIIVGVGKADFSAMEKLDGDEVRLTSSTGQRAYRDIVQFVPFRKFKSPQLLAKETLQEIPAQFLSYAKMKNAIPLDAKFAVNASETKLPVLNYQPSVHVLTRTPTLYDSKQRSMQQMSTANIHLLASQPNMFPPAQAAVVPQSYHPAVSSQQPSMYQGAFNQTPAGQVAPVPVHVQAARVIPQQAVHNPAPSAVPSAAPSAPSLVADNRVQSTADQISALESQMKAAAANMDFVNAQRLKEQIDKLKAQSAAPPAYAGGDAYYMAPPPP
mmetsp:Transcript_3867/g.9130  ORF Transcript_3867/g.9130 Transcript_3867/m.9130 type:complete len:723 (-) Transcript_3867:73-2241(-)